MRVIAVILAGGTGTRLSGVVPKQFLKIKGKTLIEYAIEAFEEHEAISEIAIVSHPDYTDVVKEMIESNGYHKVKKILCGGKERYHSSMTALDAYSGEDTAILLHDAARPLVSRRIITQCVQVLKEGAEAVEVAIPSVDTVLVADAEGAVVKEIPDRSLYYQAQTPQGFRLETLKEAYRLALNDPAFHATDDCGVVHRYLPEIPIHIVKGERRNMKATLPEDLFILETLC